MVVYEVRMTVTVTNVARLRAYASGFCPQARSDQERLKLMMRRGVELSPNINGVTVQQITVAP